MSEAGGGVGQTPVMDDQHIEYLLLEEHNVKLRSTEEARLNQLYHSKCDDKGQMNMS